MASSADLPRRRENADALNSAGGELWTAHEAIERAVAHLERADYRGLAGPMARLLPKIESTARAAEEDADMLVGE